jgi:hypothetical protein
VRRTPTLDGAKWRRGEKEDNDVADARFDVTFERGDRRR